MPFLYWAALYVLIGMMTVALELRLLPHRSVKWTGWGHAISTCVLLTMLWPYFVAAGLIEIVQRLSKCRS